MGPSFFKKTKSWKGFEMIITNLSNEQNFDEIGYKNFEGGSPGLVVMGGGSRSKGRGFESRRRILDGHDIFSH